MKLAVSELWVTSSEIALRHHGPDSGGDAGQDLCDAVGSRIYSGTSQIQRELLGHELGL